MVCAPVVCTCVVVRTSRRIIIGMRIVNMGGGWRRHCVHGIRDKAEHKEQLRREIEEAEADSNFTESNRLSIALQEIENDEMATRTKDTMHILHRMYRQTIAYCV